MKSQFYRKIILFICLLAITHLKAQTWTQKASLPGLERSYAVGFSIGNYGYIGTGLNGWIGVQLRDLWRWDQATDTWTQMPDLPGPARDAAIAISFANKGYIGTGAGDEYQSLKDFWEFCDSCYVGTNEITGFQNFLVFPNPTRDHLIIKNHDLTVEFVAEISNIYGLPVFAGSFTGERKIDLSHLQTGFYILTIINANNRYSTKLIIER